MRLSKIISIILHPIFMPITALYLSLKLIPALGFAITNYLNFIYLILLFSTIILPLMSIMFLINKKIVFSLEMSNYKERIFPLLTVGIWMCYGYYKLADFLILTPILKAEILSAITIIFTASAISKYWKISLHMLGIGGVVGVLFSLNFLFGSLQPILILSVLFAGILGAARINEKAHNNTQIYVGFLLGFFIQTTGILLL